MPTPAKHKLPRAVIFDWDNTLVDTWPLIAEAVNVTRATFGMETWSIEMAMKLCSAHSARDKFPEWFGSDSKRAFTIFYDHIHKHHLDNLRPMPGAEELLLWLKGRAIPLFVVTNKRNDVLRREAEKLGWLDWFAGMAGSMDAPRDKPERDPVDAALNHAGLKADDPAIWFVGDSQADVICARKAGCTPVLVHNPSEATRLGVGLSFLDCQALLDMLYTLEPHQSV